MNNKIRFALGFLLGGIFVVAGILKVIDPARFFNDIQNYDLIPWRTAAVTLAFYLPWLEIIVGLGVIVRPARSCSLMILITMLLTFSVAIMQAWIRGLDISCGCFGGSSSSPRYFLWIARDAGLLVVALLLSKYSGVQKSLEN